MNLPSLPLSRIGALWRGGGESLIACILFGPQPLPFKSCRCRSPGAGTTRCRSGRCEQSAWPARNYSSRKLGSSRLAQKRGERFCWYCPGRLMVFNGYYRSGHLGFGSHWSHFTHVSCCPSSLLGGLWFWCGTTSPVKGRKRLFDGRAEGKSL